MRSVDEWKAALRSALKDAMRARDTAVVSALREALAAIDNAEAADLSAAPSAQHGVIAGGVHGLGAGDVARKVLDGAAVAAIIEHEIAERRAAAATYDTAGQRDRADELRLGAAALERARQA